MSIPSLIIFSIVALIAWKVVESVWIIQVTWKSHR